MKIVSIFNNKGGVGKSTLTFHLGHALSELGKRVLLIDSDPQCNLTLYGLSVREMHGIWEEESTYIDTEGFEVARDNDPNYKQMLDKTRTLHFLLKPTEEGTGEIEKMPPLKKIGQNIFLLPGRLSLNKYEEAIASRWSDSFVGNPLAIKTISRIRTIAKEYGDLYNLDYVLIDTSPSIGIINKVIISTSDAIMVPCNPDMFSLYGIRNIGRALSDWKKQFDVLKSLLSDEKRKTLPSAFVKFAGYTLYNAKKVTTDPPKNDLDIAQSNFHYARLIPQTILQFIKPDLRDNLTEVMSTSSIGDKSIIHTHNTFPGMAQKYKQPMWVLPSLDLESEDNTIKGNRRVYEDTRVKYLSYAKAFIERINTVR